MIVLKRFEKHLSRIPVNNYLIIEILLLLVSYAVSAVRYGEVGVYFKLQTSELCEWSMH